MLSYTLSSKKVIMRLLALALAVALAVFMLSSCEVLEGLIGGKECEHADEDKSGVCDNCGLELDVECTEHRDDNCDGKCDVCGDVMKIAHNDSDDDGRCDKCGTETKAPCTEHRDDNCDGKCDKCGTETEAPCTEHSDDNCDGKCDKCGTETKAPCTEHRDDNCDGKCDVCGEGMKIAHNDSDGDGKCDGCNACLSHKDEECNGRCDVCDAPVTVNHADKDEDGKCDKCEACLSHADNDCDNQCDHCDTAINLGHSDKDDDGICDKCDRCIDHVDEGCNGKCDRCGDDIPVVHKDKDGNNLCDKCGSTVLPISIEAKKTASVSQGITLYPAEYIEWSGTTYRGALVTYTITVTNTGENVATVTVTDTVPDGTIFISGCNNKIDNNLTWTVTVPVGGEASVSYTVSIGGDKTATEGGYISGSGASVDGKSVDCYDLYVEKTLNEVDQKYIEKAIRILSTSTYTGLDFAKHAYTIAFTNSKAITELLSGTPAEILSLILEGSDEKLSRAIAPGLYGGSAVTAAIPGIKGTRGTPFTASDLVSGDILIVMLESDARMYIAEGAQLWDITNTATKVDISAIISSLSSADSYAVIRPSTVMTVFTPSNPDEIPEQMNEYQEAIVRTAEAYLLRGESLQYEDVWFGLISQSGEHRWTHGEKAPEEYTTDEWGYVNCAVFTYDVYLQALGYALPSDMYTTLNLSTYSSTHGMRVFQFTNTTPGEYSEEYMLEVQREFMQTIQVGDIINVRRKTESGTSGHAMLYVGNGRFIHSGGASFTSVNGVGHEVYEPTIRCHKVIDYIFNPTSVGGNPFRSSDEYGATYVTELILVRPLNAFKGEIPENTLSRVENMQDIRAEKTSSHPSSTTVNPGDLVTFTFTVFNVGDSEKTVSIYDKIPAGTTYVSGGDNVSGDELYWTVTANAGETVSVSYTVKVGELADGTIIDGRDGRVGGVMHRCAAIRVKKTLTAEEQAAIKAAIEELKSEGSTLTKLELVNEIYKRALGIEGIFTDTGVNNVMRDGDESVFATSTKKNNSKYLSKLRNDETYFSSMLVDHLYGGMRFDSSGKLYDRTKLLKTHNLIVGDVLIARSSSAENVYIYAGDGNLILVNSGIGATADFATLAERIMYYGRDFAVLRPSFVTE